MATVEFCGSHFQLHKIQVGPELQTISDKSVATCHMTTYSKEFPLRAKNTKEEYSKPTERICSQCLIDSQVSPFTICDIGLHFAMVLYVWNMMDQSKLLIVQKPVTENKEHTLATCLERKAA